MGLLDKAIQMVEDKRRSSFSIEVTYRRTNGDVLSGVRATPTSFGGSELQSEMPVDVSNVDFLIAADDLVQLAPPGTFEPDKNDEIVFTAPGSSQPATFRVLPLEGEPAAELAHWSARTWRIHTSRVDEGQMFNPA